MSETVGYYSSSGGALRSFDLEAPRLSVTWAMDQPRPCRVCGKERPGIGARPLGAYFAHKEHPHAACDRQVIEWEKRSDVLLDGPNVQAAWEAIRAAYDELEHQARAVLEAARMPEWFIAERLSRLLERD